MAISLETENSSNIVDFTLQIIFVATDLSNFYTLCRNTFCREVLSPFMPAMGRVDVNSTAFCLSRYLFTAATKRAIETKVAILRDTRRNMYSKHYLKCVSSTIARNYSCNGCETSLTELWGEPPTASKQHHAQPLPAYVFTTSQNLPMFNLKHNAPNYTPHLPTRTSKPSQTDHQNTTPRPSPDPSHTPYAHSP